MATLVDATERVGAGHLDVEVPPPMLRIDSLSGGDLIVTWYHGNRLYWSKRHLGSWRDPSSVELPDQAQFENWREQLVQASAGQIDPGRARVWDRDRAIPDALREALGRR